MKRKRTIVVGDVHACGIELQLLLADQVRLGIDDELVLVGDLFDRAFRPDLVWKIIQDHKATCLLGNHENKLLKFLRKERDYLPPHYYWMLQFLFVTSQTCTKDDMIALLESMPMLIEREGCLIAHAGVDVDNPTTPNESANVYGNIGQTIKPRIPHPDDKEDNWWNFYNGDLKVVYGHLSTLDRKPRIRKNRRGMVNSIGIDTACAFGGPLTAYCLETGEFWQYASRINHFAALKSEMKRQAPHWEPS